MKTNAFTIDAAILADMAAGAKRAGENLQELLVQADIPAHYATRPGARITGEQLARLGVVLTRETGDEAYGLLKSGSFPTGAFRLLMNNLIHDRTLYDALKTVQRFVNLVNNSLRLDLTSDGHRVALSVQGASADIAHSPFMILQFMIPVQRVLCWLSGSRLPLLRAEFDHPPPDYADEYQYFFLGAPVTFDHPRCALIFQRSDLDAAVVRTFAQLRTFLRAMPDQLQQTPEEWANLPLALRYWIERRITLHHHLPTLEEAAAQFGLTPQTFHRRLKSFDTSFVRIRMDCRRDLAIDTYLNGPLDIEAIADRLCFSEAASFIRFFRTETGLTPDQYRRLM